MSRRTTIETGLIQAGRVVVLLVVAGLLMACPTDQTTDSPPPGEDPRALFRTALTELNDGPCKPGQTYKQLPLGQPVEVAPHDGEIETELVVRLRERCVPVWNTETSEWEMQTLSLRTYGFPRVPGTQITEADADDPASPNIAWSAPGPTFIMHPASEPGAPDGTRYKMRLYNRMPHDSDPGACDVNYKCNTSCKEEDKDPVTGECTTTGVDPVTGQCKVPPDPAFGGVPPFVPNQTVNGQVIEPPNCFHGNNSTNFHFHGFHVSPQLGQDFVGLELRPPRPPEVAESDMSAHGPHGEHGVVAYGHFDFDVDPLRYTQPPGTHWYHAHKHGSTALQVLNGLVGTFKVLGEFDQELNHYFEAEGGGELEDRLMVVQQLQERQPGLGGVDQTGSMLVNGQADPIVRMKKGEIQRWRFVGATMQASASLNIGFPEVPGKATPAVRQIAMDGVQFSRDNYECQPFLNNPDCTPQIDITSLVETTSFSLNPGNRIDVLIQAPQEAGTYCLLHDITTVLPENVGAIMRKALAQRGAASADVCGVDASTGLAPLFTLVVEDQEKPMTFPTKEQFPMLAPYLVNIQEVTDPDLHKDIYYQMVGQTKLQGTQFWISQVKYDPNCANETLVLNQPEQWTLWNNSGKIAHPFHIHQNPFQLLSESDRGTYTYPPWRDTLAIPKAKVPTPAKGQPPIFERSAQLGPQGLPISLGVGGYPLRGQGIHRRLREPLPHPGP